jgi:hypothetical protein
MVRDPEGASVRGAESLAPVTGDARLGLAFAGRYRIIRLLGEGDRKRTYLALDTDLERQVALAMIKPEAARSDLIGTKREVDALSQAGSHDNIVTLYDRGIADRGTAEETEYLVFEYLAGGTLREYMDAVRQQQGDLPVDEVMRFGRQLARALAQLHRRGLIHRDVAPANVWLDDRKVAHLGDFDSVVQKDAGPQDPKTLPLSTEAYASPEQSSGGHVDERTDLYSLGAVLFEAATGKRPPRRHDGKLAVEPSMLRPDLPPALSAIICELLAESADDRPPSADDLLKALNSAGESHRPEEGLLPWADTLPFPLASILWGYHAELDPRSKVDYLLKFFEALAEFTAAVQLSAYRSDPAFFDANRSAWFGADPIDFGLATFGTWVTLSKRLADTAASLLSGEDGSPDRYFELYGAQDRELPQALIDPMLIKILQKAEVYRNVWIGHSGVTGRAEEQEEHLRSLEKLLTQVRALFGASFEPWIFFKPGQMTLTGKTFDLIVTRLMGTRSVFRKERVKVGQALDAGRLYLLNLGGSKALELVPLIRILAGQRTGEEACYFYNRLESNQVRWVSYHFQPDPELLLEDPDVVEFLSDLQDVTPQ